MNFSDSDLIKKKNCWTLLNVQGLDRDLYVFCRLEYIWQTIEIFLGLQK